MKIELGKPEIEQAVTMWLSAKFHNGEAYAITVKEVAVKGANYGDSPGWQITAEAVLADLVGPGDAE